MSFRRSKKASERARAWHRFLTENRELLARSGLPLRIHESMELWEDFLMHGFLDHHPDEPSFMLEELDPDHRERLKEIIVAYFQAGFGDPGLGLFSRQEREDILKAAGLR